VIYCASMTSARSFDISSDRVLVMGVLNVTPDSFYAGSRSTTAARAIEAGLGMVAAGADILDIGGESSRPGAEPVSAEIEMERTLPVIRGLRSETDVSMSVDTTKACVASAALEEGATWINDISALRFDPEMADVIAGAGAGAILMHMQGTPETMQRAPRYTDVVHEVRNFLLSRADVAIGAGIAQDRIILDPGIGFGKSLDHNLALLRNLSILCDSGYPILVGLSRKSFLGAILDVPVEKRLVGTVAANTAAILQGASIIRVHDVKEGRRTADVAVRLRS